MAKPGENFPEFATEHNHGKQVFDVRTFCYLYATCDSSSSQFAQAKCHKLGDMTEKTIDAMISEHHTEWPLVVLANE